MVNVDQPPVTGMPSVNVDDRAGARAGAEHLIALGHRRVGLFTNTIKGGQHGVVEDPLAEPNGHATRERLLGWLGVLDAAGASSIVVREPLTDAAALRDGARLLLERDERPTAVLCFSDVLAAAVVQTAQSMGLRVPQDLSVVGFDDSSLAARFDPPLTTVRQDVAAKGRAAAAALTASLQARKDGHNPPAENVVLPVELVVRQSTGPVPDRSAGSS